MVRVFPSSLFPAAERLERGEGLRIYDVKSVGPEQLPGLRDLFHFQDEDRLFAALQDEPVGVLDVHALRGDDGVLFPFYSAEALHRRREKRGRRAFCKNNRSVRAYYGGPIPVLAGFCFDLLTQNFAHILAHIAPRKQAQTFSRM